MAWPAKAAPVAIDSRLQIRHVMNTADSGAAPVRIAKDPRNDRLYYLQFDGDLHQVNLQSSAGTSTSTKIAGSAEHGISDSAQGMAIGPDGAIYFVGNFVTDNGNRTVARIMKGAPNSAGGRTWSLFARTEAYPRSRTYFDHVFNGIAVSPDGQYVFVNSGSRTDHGEVQSTGGAFPGTREVPLTAKVFRLPASGSDLLLRNDLTALRDAGYLFAEGTRNSFDFAFAPNGDLFATENGPDSDMAEELNWLRPGLHYGFPWRIGGMDNPQQFPNYNPAADRLLDPRFFAVMSGFYQNDPTFPPAPTGLVDPVVNLGPDADLFRDPADGSIRDAGQMGRALGTFTAHRSPLGLAFDRAGAMGAPFKNHGFMLSWTKGDPNGASVTGPFRDASEDLVDLDLSKLGETNYQARVTRLVGGFANPIDAEIIGHRIYVIEYGGQQGIWEVTFPIANTPPTVSAIADQTVNWNQTTAAIPFAVGDAETAPSALIVTASSSNQVLVPDANIALSGTGANRTLAVTPAQNQVGQTTITVTVTDAGNERATASFMLNVIRGALVRGDFNGDGKPDLLFQDDGGYLAVWLMNGAELAAASYLNPSHVGNVEFRVVGSGDFNRDGHEDIAFQHTDGTLAVWGMRGTTLGSAALLSPSHPGDRNWRVAATGDIDRDDRTDLVFQHSDGTLAVWLMNGLALNRAALLDPSHPGDSRWKVVGSGDLDVDGNTDLVFQHVDGTLASWRMVGTKLASAALFDPPHPGDINWRVAATGPYGSFDLIFQHTDYTMAIWRLEGNKLLAAQLLKPSNSGATWKIVAPR